MGGTSYAAVKINGNQIKNGTVANKALKAKTIKGNKVKLDALTGKQVKESTLGQVPSAASADSAPPVGSAGGGLSGAYPNPEVADGSIVSSKLGTITRRSKSLGVGGGSAGSLVQYCLAGETVIGGGFSGAYEMQVMDSRAVGTTGWSVGMRNDTASSQTATFYAYCLAP
ncbi:hypothetical protein GCM10027020_12100 [Nocardioides salsibiostraticola]